MDEDISPQLIEIAVLKEQIRNMKEAITLQAKEYERRLQELNHSHQIQLERNAMYVPREAWEIKNAEIEVWRRDIDKTRWVAMGMGIAGGAIAELLLRLTIR